MATEAYLGTAIKRRSIRGHARLLDYRLDEGLSARAWVVIDPVDAGKDGATIKAGTRVQTRSVGVPGSGAEPPVVFETLHARVIRAKHVQIGFHNWSGQVCCLARGTTRASLVDTGLSLQPGDALLLRQTANAKTGEAQLADPRLRQVVRLTEVEPVMDDLTGTPTLSVAWDAEDALAFDLPLIGETSLMGPELRSRTPMPMSCSPSRARARCAPRRAARSGATRCAAASACRASASRSACPMKIPPHARPPRPGRSVRTRSRRCRASTSRGTTPNGIRCPICSAPTPLRRSLSWRAAATSITRCCASATGGWAACRPIRSRNSRFIMSRASAPEGMSAKGRWWWFRASPGSPRPTRFPPKVPANPSRSRRCGSPAPYAFKKNKRCVTPADYARKAEAFPGVQRATAYRCWASSWYSTFIVVDRLEGAGLDARFTEALLAFIEPERMAGDDLAIVEPRRVPLDIALRVCLADGYRPRDVEVALRKVLGRSGFFDPDRFSFGDPVYLSALIAAAAAVAGVDHVTATRFQRWGRAPKGELDAGVLGVAGREILSCDNDANFPENGRLALEMVGGL